MLWGIRTDGIRYKKGHAAGRVVYPTACPEEPFFKSR